MGKKIKDMVGKKFGRWTVILETDRRDLSGNVMYLCKCDCGTEKVVSGYALRSGASTSCGCYNHDVITKFGSSLYKEKLYGVWHGMIQRCHNKKDKAFKNYGGRGISVCEEWKSSYKAFKDWALESGYRDGLWIERIENNGPYAPWNCTWKSPSQQARNKRTNFMITINGETKCITDWAKESGIKVATIKRRWELGWPKSALLNPVNKRHSHGKEISEAMKNNGGKAK